MSTTLIGWRARGFGLPPSLRMAADAGLPVYRAWGGGSSEWGSGFFSLEKPRSVLDAELRFNIADWGNRILYVSTFLIRPGVEYWQGPVLHGEDDLSAPGTQIFVEPLITAKVLLRISGERLRQDAHVGPRAGNA